MRLLACWSGSARTSSVRPAGAPFRQVCLRKVSIAPHQIVRPGRPACRPSSRARAKQNDDDESDFEDYFGSDDLSQTPEIPGETGHTVGGEDEENESSSHAPWLEVGGPLGRVPAPEFWLGGEGFGTVRGPRGEPDWTLPISDNRVDSYSYYLQELALNEALKFHDENQKRARNRFVLVAYAAKVLQQLTAEDKAASKVPHDPRFFIPPWMRAEKILHEQMDEINEVAKRAEDRLASRSDDRLERVAEEHLRQMDEYRADINDSNSYASQTYVEADQTPGLDGPKTEVQRREDLEKFDGLGLDFLVKVLPGAGEMYPELDDGQLLERNE